MVLPDIQIRRLESWRLGDTKAMPASALIDRLLKNMEEWDLWSTGWAPDVVLIEQQMRGAHINIALAFATYTCMKLRFPHAIVKFVRPGSKFTAFVKFIALSDESVQKKLHDKSALLSYAKRKHLAVEVAESILRQQEQPNLQSHCPGAKKDDLADAFLQSFCV